MGASEEFTRATNGALSSASYSVTIRTAGTPIRNRAHKSILTLHPITRFHNQIPNVFPQEDKGENRRALSLQQTDRSFKLIQNIFILFPLNCYGYTSV